MNFGGTIFEGKLKERPYCRSAVVAEISASEVRMIP